MIVKRYDFDCYAFYDSARLNEQECDDGDYVLYSDYAALLACHNALVEALPDPDKLEILARWFDMKYPSDANPEVQTDLREWAKKIRRALEEKP